MRILWFTNILLPDAAKAMGLPVFPTGGWMSAQLEALRQHAPELDFFVLTTHHMHRRVVVDGVTYATFGNPRRVVYSESVPLALELEVRELVREFNPDLIHIHGSEDFYARLSAEALCNKPVLVSLQGIINAYHPHYNGNLSPFELAPFRTLRNRLFRDGVFESQKRWALQCSAQERISLGRHWHYAGRTDWDRNWLSTLNPEGEYHHLDEIMRPEFYKTQRDPSTICRHSIYCSAAAGYPLKGLHWLLRAVAVLKPRYPDIQVEVANAQGTLSQPRGMLARLKDSNYPAYLRNLVADLGLQENVIGLPALSALEVAEALKRAHVFCLPSLCENSPNSLGEAMLVGTPSVATYVGGVPSILESEREGLLCPAADPASLASAIGRLFDDASLAAEFAANASRSAKHRHNPLRVACETRKLYEYVATQERI